MSIGDNRLPALADDIRKLHRSIERNAEKIAHDAIEADTTVKAPRQRRHLSDHILIAFHQACDERAIVGHAGDGHRRSAASADCAGSA